MALDTVDPTFDGRLKEVYASAIEEELWIDTYAATNRMEYFAEITQSYFDTNRVNDRDHNDIDTREELRAHDPRGFALCVEVYGADAPRYQRPFDRDPASVGFEHLRSWDRSKAPTFAWPVEVVRAWDRHQAGTLVPRRKRGESAMAFLKRRVAAEEPAALVEMGWRHREGEGVAQDDQLAVVYYRRASEQGDPAGMDSYGWMLKEGRGVEEDDQEAIALFRKSAEAGFSQGMFNLALMLRDGRGVEAPDHDGARAWLAQAAQRGHVTAARLLQEWSP